MFDVSEPIRLASRVTIPWRLTLSSDIGRSVEDEGVVPRASRKATFNCPRRNDGVFYVRYSQLLYLIADQVSQIEGHHTRKLGL